MSGLFTRLARKARGGDIGAARLLVPTPFEADAPPAEPAGELDGWPVATARGPASAAAMAVRRLERDEERHGGTPLRVPGPSSPSAITASAAVGRGAEALDPKDGPHVQRVIDDISVGAGRHVQQVAESRAAESRGSVSMADDGTLLSRQHTETAAAVSRSASSDRLAAEPTAAGPMQRLDDPRIAPSDAEPTDDAPLLGPVPRSRLPASASRSGDRHDRSHAIADADHGADARPVVRVTIGRIDVRGTPPAAAPSRPAAVRHQPLGLDEYLRRRDLPGGGSR